MAVMGTSSELLIKSLTLLARNFVKVRSCDRFKANTSWLISKHGNIDYIFLRKCITQYRRTLGGVKMVRSGRTIFFSVPPDNRATNTTVLVLYFLTLNEMKVGQYIALYYLALAVFGRWYRSSHKQKRLFLRHWYHWCLLGYGTQ